MKRRTIAAIVVLFFVLVSGGIFAAVQIVESDGTLTELWISNTARDAIGNHHAPAIARTDTETIILAPVNAPQKVGDCALVAFDTALDRKWKATVPPEACNIHAFGDPTVADLDDDGTREVFVATTEAVVHAYDLRTGREEFSRDLAHWGYAAPRVTNFTPSEGRELIVVDLSGGVFVYDSKGTLIWNRTLSSVTAPVFVEDFDADGADELAVGEGKNVTILERDGTVAQRTPVGASVNWLTTGQADDDDAVEIVAATLSGDVVSVDGKTGAVTWRQQFGSLAAVHAFGDGDDDGQPEVYAVARDGTLRALNASDGTVEWTTTLTAEDVQMTPPPAIGDLDGDEDLELVAVSQDGVVSVVDPKSGGVIASYERDVPIWMWPTLADLDGDGTQEILVTYGDGRIVSLSFAST